MDNNTNSTPTNNYISFFNQPSVSEFGSGGVKYIGFVFNSSVTGYINNVLCQFGSSETGSHVIYIYNQNTLIHTQNIPSYTAGAWNNIPLSTPVQVLDFTNYTVLVNVNDQITFIANQLNDYTSGPLTIEFYNFCNLSSPSGNSGNTVTSLGVDILFNQSSWSVVALQGSTGSTGPTGATGPPGTPNILFLNPGANLTANNFIGQSSTSVTEEFTTIIATRNMTVSNMYVNLVTAPTSTNVRTFTVRKNGVATALTVSITGTATTGSNIANSFTVDALDRISLQNTVTGAPVDSGAQISIEIL